eukprot:Rmarinus@m.3068
MVKRKFEDAIRADTFGVEEVTTERETSALEDLLGSDSDDEIKEDYEALVKRRTREKAVKSGQECPYLDTINRAVLDFDFEKLCSVSLTNLNVYACLVCGKYFNGRGPKTNAYLHALQCNHHVFINLHTEKVYVLPDSYEVEDSSLDDIKAVLNPKFDNSLIKKLDTTPFTAQGLDGMPYIPGTVGLNNIKETDYVNVVIQALQRVRPLRNFFLRHDNFKTVKSPLLLTFSELTRKLWHAHNFKGQVSPHEFLQAVSLASNKRFRSGKQRDVAEFLSWLLNAMHRDLTGGKKTIQYRP